ncbi:MAG TPA: hypothetical protein DIT07_16890 [Sphingobacteriaceae bacterium]|nr:hypothetical protein [Sphingobacteriaceae bacterium]
MKLISDIINDLVNDQISLTVPLNKTKVLATRIDNKILLDWVNLELKGYPNNGTIPLYRKTSGTLVGNFTNNGYLVSNYPLPLPEMGEELDLQLKEFRMLDNIATLEGFLTSYNEHNNDSLISVFSDGLLRSIENIMRNTNGPYFQLTSAGIKVPIHFSTQVLSAIKDKLLDFMLNLETEFGIETEITDLKNNNAKINYIMNNTINTTGDGNIINTGDKSKITAEINITKGNKELLEKTLKENGVNHEDITELLNVIDTEQPTDNSFGIKVNSWLQKMLSKSLDGSWQVGIGAAGTLLAEALKSYYGW